MQHFDSDTPTEKHAICVVPPEQHYASYRNLVDDVKFYEKSRAYFYTEHPNFAPPKDKFEIVRNNKNKDFILLPTSLDRGVIYRGQGMYYEPCLPTLYRQPRTEEEIFIEYVRIAEFRLLLEQYGITKRFEQNHYNIDYVGLAQHYGLNTSVLDFTSDVEIALFFAMCDYDKAEDKYKPKTDDKEYVGYIYAKLTRVSSDDRSDKDPFGTFSDEVRVIGMQPFKRPGAQRGFSYNVDSEGLKDGYLYSFSYTKEDSERIFNKYHESQDLWCKDEIADYAKLIKSTTVFSSQAISLATKMFDHTQSVTKRVKRLKENGYSVTGQSKLQWFNVGHPCTEDDWLKIRKELVQRSNYAEEGKKSEYCNTSLIGEELLFNYIYGCTDCPQGYDSGMVFEKFNEGTIGLQTKRDHTPLKPDARDGKIHPEWSTVNSDFKRVRSFEIPDVFKMSLVKKNFK